MPTNMPNARNDREMFAEEYEVCIRAACAEMGIPAESLISKMPPLPASVLDRGQMDEYFAQLTKNGEDLMTGEECVAALKASEMVVGHIHDSINRRFGDLPEFK